MRIERVTRKEVGKIWAMYGLIHPCHTSHKIRLGVYNATTAGIINV
jgi:hypothetical protein